MAELAKSHLQIIMLQDGVGAKHVTLDQLGTYYQSAQKGLFEETKTTKELFGQIWKPSILLQGNTLLLLLLLIG